MKDWPQYIFQNSLSEIRMKCFGMGNWTSCKPPCPRVGIRCRKGSAIFRFISHKSTSAMDSSWSGAPAGAPDQEESIALVDLCEMNRNIALPFRQRIPTRGHGGLHDVQFPIPKHFIRISLREFWKIYCGQSFILDKTCRDRRDQWT